MVTVNQTFFITDLLVGEAIVVIRRLVSGNQGSIKSLTHLTKFFMKNYEQITVPMAKASILWLISHYISLLEKLAPDALRIAVRNFCAEITIVKIFIINLSVTLFITHKKTDSPLHSFSDSCLEYVLTLANFDNDVDVRDFGRMVAQISKIDSDGGFNNKIFDIFKGTVPPMSVIEQDARLEALESTIIGSIPSIMGFGCGPTLFKWATTPKGEFERNVKEVADPVPEDRTSIMAEVAKVPSKMQKPLFDVPLDDFYADNGNLSVSSLKSKLNSSADEVTISESGDSEYTDHSSEGSSGSGF